MAAFKVQSDTGGMSRSDRHFLALALHVAETSQARWKHGAVVVRNGNVLSRACNKKVNSPDVMTLDHIKGVRQRSRRGPSLGPGRQRPRRGHLRCASDDCRGLWVFPPLLEV